MKKLTLILTTLLFVARLAQAQEVNSLLDVLVEKKLLTPEDAEKVKVGIAKDTAQTAAGKLKLTEAVTELKLYGDGRFRYQYDQADAQYARPSANASSGTAPTDARLGSNPNVNQRTRARYRLRLGADFKLGDAWFGGFGLATGQSADSNMQAFTQGFDNYGIFINKVFLGWKPADWATVIIGKQDNPFYTTDLVWDSDINPQGLVEKIDISKRFFPDSKFTLALTAGQFLFHDNDEFRRGTDASTDAWIFETQLKASYKFKNDNVLTVAPAFMAYTAADVGGLLNTRAFSDASFPTYDHPVQTQTTTTNTNLVTVAYDSKGIPSRTVTPVNTVTTVQVTDPSSGSPRAVTTTSSSQQQQVKTVGNSTTGLPQFGLPVNLKLANKTFTNTEASGKGTTVVTNPLPSSMRGENRNLALLLFPGDYAFKIGNIKSKFYWDFSYNLLGRKRFEETYGLSNALVPTNQNLTNPIVLTGMPVNGQKYSARDSLAWLVGFQLGDNKKKGDWQLYANYRETGIASVDPNLNDSDFALSALNVRGYKVGASYNFTDALSGGVAYSSAWNLRKNLIGGQATTGSGLADLNNVSVFQIDVNLKF